MRMIQLFRHFSRVTYLSSFSAPSFPVLHTIHGSALTVMNLYYHSDSEDSAASWDDHKRIRLPILKYGYRTEPLEWEELVNIIQVQKDLAMMSRSVEQQRDYEMYKRDLLRQWSSVTDHVLCDKFPCVFEKRLDKATERNYAYPSLQEFAAMGSPVYKALVQNDFPYYTAEGIEHWVLWKLGGVCSDNDIDEAKLQLHYRFGEDMLHWINPPHLKSLPEIDHVHILGRVVAVEKPGSVAE